MSTRVTAPTLEPACVGVKVILRWQVDGGTVDCNPLVQLLFCTAKSPVAVTLVRVNAAVPVFEMVIVWGTLATPTDWVAKSRLVGE